MGWVWKSMNFTIIQVWVNGASPVSCKWWPCCRFVCETGLSLPCHCYEVEDNMSKVPGPRKRVLISLPCVIHARLWWFKHVTLMGFGLVFVFTHSMTGRLFLPFIYSFHCDFIFTWTWDRPSYAFIYLLFTTAYAGLSQGRGQNSQSRIRSGNRLQSLLPSPSPFSSADNRMGAPL